MNPKDRYEELTQEQKEKALACKSPEQLLALASEEGFELSDKELEAVSGGWLEYPDCWDLKPGNAPC